MDFKERLTDTSRHLADVLVTEIDRDEALYRKLYEFIIKQEKIYAMRASRVFSLLAMKYPSLIHPYFKDIVDILPNLKDYSVKRNFLQFLRKYYWHRDEEILGKLIDVCFKFCISDNEPIAVRAFALDILFKISKKEPLIKPELISTLEIISLNDSTTLQHQANKLLKII